MERQIFGKMFGGFALLLASYSQQVSRLVWWRCAAYTCVYIYIILYREGGGAYCVYILYYYDNRERVWTGVRYIDPKGAHCPPVLCELNQSEAIIAVAAAHPFRVILCCYVYIIYYYYNIRIILVVVLVYTCSIITRRHTSLSPHFYWWHCLSSSW